MSDFESNDDVAARIKEQADIVMIIGERVDLKKSGSRYLGLCPFHGEKTPSFSVHPAKQFFYCFGCGESGDVFSFVMKYHNLDFSGALKELAERFHIQLPERPLSHQEKRKASIRKKMVEVNRKVTSIFRDYLLKSANAERARRYLKNRQISLQVQDKFQIGYAPSTDSVGWNFLSGYLRGEEINVAESLGLIVKKDSGGYYDRFRDRVMFPISGPTGNVIGFGGRIVGDGQPKYMNSPESAMFDKSKSLFGFFQNQDAIRKERKAVLVEGNFDLISLVDCGFSNVTAPLGTALTSGQLILLKRFCEEVVLLFDGDAAGVKAAVRAVPLFLAAELSGKVALLPEGHDPDSFVRERGLDELRKLTSQAMPLPEFVFEKLVEEYGLTLDGKRRIAQELKPLVQAAASPLQQSVVVTHFSEKLGLPVEDLRKVVEQGSEKVKEPVVGKKIDNETRLEPLTSAQDHIIRFMVLNPSYFHELECAGIRKCLEGTIGEVLFLQMKRMVEAGGDLQPEELLTVLPEGVERFFVAQLLENASFGEHMNDISGITGENERGKIELIEWIRCDQLRRKSERLTVKMREMQSVGDFDGLQQLLAEKVNIDNELRKMID